MPGFGGEVKLTGEEAYRRSLTAITEALKENGAALKSVAEQYAKSDKSTTSVTSAQKELQSILQKQKNTLDQSRQAYGQYAATLEEQKVKHQALVKEYKDAIKELENIRKTSGETSEAYKTQAEKVEKLKQQVADSNAEYAQSKATLKEYKSAMNDAEKAVKGTEAQLEKLDSGMEETEDSTKRAGESAQKAAQGGFTVMKGVIADLSSKVIQSAIQGFKNLAKSVADIGIEFDSAMSKVAAISGATAEDLEKLTEKAQEMGRTTKFTASESAEAFNYMAMAGWKTQEMLDGIEGILNLAAASGADLATTSDIVTDALTGMGYAAKDAGRLADVMAAAAANANTTVEMMGVTFQYTTPIAGSLGYTMEDVALAIGLMANSGIKGERAGTALRSIMQRLASDTGKARTTLEDLGVTVINGDGTMRNFRDVLRDARKALNGLTDAQKTSVAKTVAGAQAMAGFLAIINATDENFNQLAMSIDNSNGAADRMAKTMLNNVGGKMTLLKSQLESIQLVIWKKLEPTVKKCIDTISSALRKIDWERAGKKAAEAFEGVTNVFVWLIDNWKTVVAAIKGVIAAFVVTKVVNFTMSLIQTVSALGQAVAGATSLSGALSALGTAIAANPIGLLVGLVAGLGVTLVSVVNNMNDTADAATLAAEKLEEQTEQIKTNSDAWKELVDAQQQSLDADMTQITRAEALYKELEDLVDINGKVKDGYEGRAKFIVGQLNDALGTEIKMTDGVIENYKELQTSIDDVIAKKKAEAILNSQQALYEEAITKQAEAYKTLGDVEAQLEEKRKKRMALEAMLAKAEEQYSLNQSQTALKNIQHIKSEMAALDEETANVQSNYDQQLALIDEYSYNIGQYESNMALAHEGKYNEMSTVTWNYVKDFQDAENVQKATLESQIATTNTQLDYLKKKYAETGDDIYKNQITTAENQKKEYEKQLQQYQSTTRIKLDDVVRLWNSGLGRQVNAITGKNIEFKDAGNGEMKMYIDGIESKTPEAIQKVLKIANSAVTNLRSKNPEAKGAGQNLVDSFGAGGSSRRESVLSTFGGIAANVLATMKRNLGIHSPSRYTREMGQYLMQGLSYGLTDEQQATIEQAQLYGQEVVDAMSAGLRTGVDTSAIAAVRDAIPEDINGNIRIAAAGNAAIAEAESPLVGAFKQALSEMKIELDSEVAGEFVDKKVTKLVYNL